jgi:cobaltochelatase CobS
MATAKDTTTTPADDRVKCEICGALTHSIQHHLKQEHPEFSMEQYRQQFPDSPILSNTAIKKMEEMKSKEGAKVVASMKTDIPGIKKMPFHETFGIPASVKGAMNARGEPIPITVVDSEEDHDMIAEIDDNYIFDIDILKNAMLGLELNIPTYIWGHSGCGKSTFWEQISNRTKRPMIRVQHTVNTEESHLIGQWTVRDGATKFELGPLAVAMKRGWLYLADEYDFALPSVLSVYQPVLEGKSLVIKEADAENRIIKPHPNFRIVATGNTNGSGDDTGLYQGTSIQNEANYDRFGVTLQMKYMKDELETAMIAAQADILPDDAKRLVEFGALIREAYEGAKISKPISPRALINAALLGQRRNSWRVGINLAFSNKLNRVDREVADTTAKRIFGA